MPDVKISALVSSLAGAALNGLADIFVTVDQDAAETKRTSAVTITQAGLRDGASDLDHGGNAITNVGNIDGRDVSADGAKLDAHIAATANPHQTTTQQAVDQQAGTAVTVDSTTAVRLDNDTDTSPVLGLGGTAAAPRIRTYDTFGGAAFEVDEDGNVPTALDITARRFSADDGSTASAAFRFSSENTGFYLNAAGQISFLIAGVQALWLNGTHLRPPGSALSLGDSTRKFQATYTGVLRVNDGTSGAPAIRFDSEATGFFLPSPGVLRAQVDGGVDALTLDPASGSTVHGDLTVTGTLAGDGGIELTEQAEPATPAANQAALYAADDGAGVSALYAKDDDGTVHELTNRARKTTTGSDASTTITLSDADDGRVIWCTAASTITVTVPDTLSPGFTCELLQGNAGQVQLAAGGSAFLRHPSAFLPNTAEQWSSVVVTSLGSNQMLVRGDLEKV